MSSLAEAAQQRLTLEPLAKAVARDTFTGTPQVVCDAYVDAIELFATPTPWGWIVDDSENIDHHAPGARFEAQVSSANLALARVAHGGVVAPGVPVRITHTDCDSILSAGIVSGLLPAHDEFGEAAIAADHTGVAHPIADLLQAVEDTRSLSDSFSALEAHLAGHTLPAFADRALNERLTRREHAADAVRAGHFELIDGFACFDFDGSMEGEFFAPLLPQARVIVLSTPYPDRPDQRLVRVRLGQAARAEESLHALRLNEVDSAYGGRWNAGSNRRGGGTPLMAAAWVRRYITWASSHELHHTAPGTR